MTRAIDPPAPDLLPPLLIAGASGHAAVLIELVRAEGRYRPFGCIAAGSAAPADVLGVPVLGGDEAWGELRGRGIGHAVVAIGDNRMRARVGAALRAHGFTLANAIHPSAQVSPSAILGEGVAVMAGAVVNARTRIGDLAILNTRCGVDHDCVVGAAAHVAPGATVAGTVRIGEGAFVGAGATIVPGLDVGAWSTIGAGSLVLRDLAATTTAFGIPARPRSGA